MIMRIDTSFRILGYPGFAMMLLALAFAGAAYLAVQIIRHDRQFATHVTRRPPHPRSHPGLWNQRPHRRRRSYQPAPDPRQTQPKGIATAWTRVRRLIWSWWPWAILCVYYIDQHATGGRRLASGCGPACARCRRRQEFPPQYGLDHGLDGRRRRNFSTPWPARPACRSCRATRSTLLNNGDRFYPAMLQDIDAGRAFDHHRGLHLLGRRNRPAPSPRRSRPAAQRGVKVKLLLDAVGSPEHRQRDPQDPRKTAAATSRGTTRFASRGCGASTTARTASR